MINLPLALDHFKGREAVLEELEKSCNFDTWKVENPTQILHIYGPTGIGKTETALVFANRRLDKFSFIWYIKCDDEFLCDESYRSLARSKRSRDLEDRGTNIGIDTSCVDAA